MSLQSDIMKYKYKVIITTIPSTVLLKSKMFGFGLLMVYFEFLIKNDLGFGYTKL